MTHMWQVWEALKEDPSFRLKAPVVCQTSSPLPLGSFSYHAFPSTGFPWAIMFSMTHPSPGVTALRCRLLVLSGHSSYNVDAGTLAR